MRAEWNGRFPGAAALALLLAFAGCGGSGGGSDGGPSGPRQLVGFSAIPPRPDAAIQLPLLEATLPHSNAGLVQLSIPWAVLLDGISSDTEVRAVRRPLADYYRSRGKAVVVALDVTNGLNRSEEDPALVAAGRSITEPAIQALYLDYAAAVASILQPEYLSLAAETNLIRTAAPAEVYAAVVTMVGAAAPRVATVSSDTRVMVSVQVETAWGRLQGSPYVGIDRDRQDFPFIQVLGLSSYPYLGGYLQPAAIPDDYYSRLVAGAPLPVMVLEGGWPSVPVGSVAGTPAMQAAYIRRHAELLAATDSRGVFQITFTDLDLAFWPPGIEPFAYNGLVDTALQPKPALAAWDEVFKP